VADVSKNRISMNLVEIARQLCQNVDVEIRKIMVDEVLGKLCYAIEIELMEPMIFEKIMELVYDAEIKVKVSAIELVFNILDIIPT